MDGAVHERLICDDDIALAKRLAGVPGTVDGGNGADVLTVITLEYTESPIAFVAYTRIL